MILIILFVLFVLFVLSFVWLFWIMGGSFRDTFCTKRFIHSWNDTEDEEIEVPSGNDMVKVYHIFYKICDRCGLMKKYYRNCEYIWRSTGDHIILGPGYERLNKHEIMYARRDIEILDLNGKVIKIGN